MQEPIYLEDRDPKFAETKTQIKWNMPTSYEKGCPPDEGRLQGILCFYINVGQLPPLKAEAFIERVKAGMDLSRLKKQVEVFFLPVREGRTKVEYIPFGY